MKKFEIEQGEHPVLPRVKVTWLKYETPGVVNRTNIEYADEVLRKEYEWGALDGLEYLEALRMVKQYKKSKKKKKEIRHG